MDIHNDEPKRALIIDDEKDFLFMMTRQFSKIGFNVETAENSIEAIKKVNTFFPNFIVIDVMLTDESGLNLCKQVKRISDATVVICSAVTPINWEGLIKEYGADFFVPKQLMPEFIKIIKGEKHNE